jgi:hypothetical protein
LEADDHDGIHLTAVTPEAVNLEVEILAASNLEGVDQQ